MSQLSVMDGFNYAIASILGAMLVVISMDAYLFFVPYSLVAVHTWLLIVEPDLTYVAFSSRLPLNLALITVDVIAGNTVFLSAIIELVPAPANITLREMTS